MAAPGCMMHTEGEDACAGTQSSPPEHVPEGETAHARAWVSHTGGMTVAAPPLGVHEPVGCGAATVTAVARIGPPHEEETVCVVPPLEQSGASNPVRTGAAQDTPVAAPQPQLVQVAAGAMRSPLPSNKLAAPPAHAGGAPAPT
jgi:hypothetical protein